MARNGTVFTCLYILPRAPQLSPGHVRSDRLGDLGQGAAGQNSDKRRKEKINEKEQI